MTDTTEPKRAEDALHLLLEVTAAGSAGTVSALALACIQKICEWQRWDYGSVWVPSATGDTLVCLPETCYSKTDLTSFREASLETRFLRGLGLPGIVWQKGKALWSADVAQESNFTRKSLAFEAGLKSAFAFPVRLGERVLAVFEFFFREAREPAAPLQAMAAKLGEHLGEAFERKAAEEARQRNENRLAARVTQLPAAIWTTDRELRIVSLEGAMSQLPVYAGMVGKKTSEFSPDNDASERGHRRAMQGFTATYETAFGGRGFECCVAPLVDSSGNVTGTIGVAVDVSELKKVPQAALPDTEAHWQLLCEKSGMGILSVDVDSRILSANPAAQQLFGYTEPELKQLTTLELTHEDDRERTRWIIQEMLAGRKKVHRFEKRYRRKDGRVVWANATGTLARNALGEPWFFTLMLEDNSVRKRAEAALGRLSERLRRLQDEERRRLARELHDSTAQSLAALNLNLGVVETSADRLGSNAQSALRDAISLASQSAREIRTFAYLLHPPELEELGLGPALTAYVEGFAQRTGIRVELNLPRKLGGIPRELELNVFRLVQENLAAHSQRRAGVKSVSVCVVRLRESLVVEMSGWGNSPRDISARSMNSTIAGMRERARQLGGTLVLSRKAGAAMKITLPLPRRKGSPHG